MSSMEPGSFFSTVVLKPGIRPVTFAPAEHKPTTIKQGAEPGRTTTKASDHLVVIGEASGSETRFSSLILLFKDMDREE